MADAAQAAYTDALKMLARRELSEAQVRQRLGRRGHLETAIESAVARLREERAIDDGRVADAIARTEISTKSRGARRAERQIVQAGITPEIARRATRAVSETVDPEALIEIVARETTPRRRTIDRRARPFVVFTDIWSDRASNPTAFSQSSGSTNGGQEPRRAVFVLSRLCLPFPALLALQ